MANDRELIAAAMVSTGLSARALSHVLAVDASTVRRWQMVDKQSTRRAMPGPARQLCRVLIEWPEAALLLGPD
jgi:DNA-binding transcriptional regulator YiaG